MYTKIERPVSGEVQGMRIIENADMSHILWYKLGGTAKYLLEVSSKEDVLNAISFTKEKGVGKVFVCGTGANLIFPDGYYDGAVVRFTRNESPHIALHDGGEVEAFAGELLDDVIQFGFAHNRIGLEWAGGLPGTVGAAVRGNVGAYGGEVSESVVSAEVIDYSGEKPIVQTLSNDELAFVYRGSTIKTSQQLLVTSARFQLRTATDEEVSKAKEVYQEKIDHRKARHPLEYPNCGSVFKNIKVREQIEKVLSVYPDMQEDIEKNWFGKVSAAALIERFGLKGFSVGGAQVSEKHALFIVNKDHATAQDVLSIIDTIQQKFQETFGFQLEPEVEIVR